MILSDKDIIKELESNRLVVEPYSSGAIQAASLDISLGNHYLKLDGSKKKINSLDEEVYYRDIYKDEIIIDAHSFILATTKEYLSLPSNLTAFVEGRSSIGRIGLFIQNAGWVDAGFEGNITLELYNASDLPILLTEGRRIGQLVFCQMTSPSQFPYKGKYQGQKGATGSRIHQDEKFQED